MYRISLYDGVSLQQCKQRESKELEFDESTTKSSSEIKTETKRRSMTVSKDKHWMGIQKDTIDLLCKSSTKIRCAITPRHATFVEKSPPVMKKIYIKKVKYIQQAKPDRAKYRWRYHAQAGAC